MSGKWILWKPFQSVLWSNTGRSSISTSLQRDGRRCCARMDPPGPWDETVKSGYGDHVQNFLTLFYVDNGYIAYRNKE